MRIFLILLLLCLVEFIAACATTSSSSSVVAGAKPAKYELSLQGTLDNVPFTGIALGSSAKTHTITMQTSVDVNWFTAQSCHRSISLKDPSVETSWLGRWIQPHRSYSFTYNEAPGFEDTGECILRICAYSNTVGAEPVQCAAIDFKNDAYQLPAENICNGADGQASGTSLCHTKVGLEEGLRFAGTVLGVDISDQVQDGEIPRAHQCKGQFTDAAQTSWKYVVPNEECVVHFMEKDKKDPSKPRRVLKHTVIPYDLQQYLGGK